MLLVVELYGMGAASEQKGSKKNGHLDLTTKKSAFRSHTGNREMSGHGLHGCAPFILMTCHWLKGPRAGLWELLSELRTCSFQYSQWGPDVTEERLGFWKQQNVLKVELAIKQMIKLRNINTVKKIQECCRVQKI